MLRPTNKIQNIDISTLEVYWDMFLLGSFWMGDPKIKAIGTTSAGAVIIEKNINSTLLNKSDFILCIGSDTFPASDSVTENNFQNYITDAGDSQMLPKSSRTMWFRINYCETNSNNDTPFTIVISGTKLQLTAIADVDYSINRDMSDGIIVLGLKKNFVLIHNIKPPYLYYKVVNIYHISPQTKGGDNMLRKVRLSKKPFQDDVQLADDAFNDFFINISTNLNIQNENKGEYLFPYGYIRNNNGYSLFNTGARFNNANFTFIRLGRNTVRVVMSYCIKLDKIISNTISYSNPFGTTAYDDMISIHVHFKGFLGHYPDKAKQIGLTTAEYMKITNASGSGYICINTTTGEDMPDLFLARTSLYTTGDGVILSSHERYITNPSSGSMWTGRTTFSIEYINFSYDVIMTLDDKSFTQESLDWFDMTEKKRNLINILNISPLNYNKYKEVS